MKPCPSNPFPARKFFLCLSAAFGVSVGAQSALAAPTCSYGPTPAVFTIMAPTGTFTVAANAPVGTQLTPWTAWQSPGFSWGCTYYGDEIGIGLAFSAAFSGSALFVGESYYTVMPTSLVGVGLIAEHKSVARVAGTPVNNVGAEAMPLRDSWGSPWDYRWYDKRENVEFGYDARVAFVKTGEIESGMARVSGAVSRVGVYDTATASINPIRIGQVNVSGSATFSAPTCTTPDVTVDLGQHKDSDFPSVGSRRGASGSFSDFLINLSDCYRYVPSLSYSFHPLNGVVAGMPGLMNISPNSSARGVGIRIMQDSGDFLPFDTKTPVAFAHQSLYMHLSAAMERTDWNAFAGGSVLGYVDFTIFYD